MNPNRFDYKTATVILRFDEGDLDGLEVVMRSVSVGQLLDMSGLADHVKGGSATADQAQNLFTLFAGRLQSWNLHIDGEPVPTTAEGVRSLDAGLFLQIFEFWFECMTKAPKASTTPAEPSGGPTLQDLPMAPLRAV